MTPETLTVTARPHPFAEAGVCHELPPGLTLREIVEQEIKKPWMRGYACVAVDGELVPPAYYREPSRLNYRPKAGHVVSITVVVPRGGGGGEGGGKNTWGAVLSAIVLIAAVALQAWPGVPAAIGGLTGASGGAAVALGSAAIAAGTFGSSLGINGLMPARR